MSKDFSGDEESAIVRMVQSVAVPLIGNVCHVFMNGLNRVQVFGVDKLHEALLNRPKNKPLLTVRKIYCYFFIFFVCFTNCVCLLNFFGDCLISYVLILLSMTCEVVIV